MKKKFLSFVFTFLLIISFGFSNFNNSPKNADNLPVTQWPTDFTKQTFTAYTADVANPFEFTNPTGNTSDFLDYYVNVSNPACKNMAWGQNPSSDVKCFINPLTGDVGDPRTTSPGHPATEQPLIKKYGTDYYLDVIQIPCPKGGFLYVAMYVDATNSKTYPVIGYGIKNQPLYDNNGLLDIFYKDSKVTEQAIPDTTTKINISSITLKPDGITFDIESTFTAAFEGISSDSTIALAEVNTLYNDYLGIDLGFTEHYDGTALTNDSFANKYPGDDQGKYDWTIYQQYSNDKTKFTDEQNAILGEWKTNLQNELDNANLQYTTHLNGDPLTNVYDTIKSDIAAITNKADADKEKTNVTSFKDEQNTILGEWKTKLTSDLNNFDLGFTKHYNNSGLAVSRQNVETAIDACKNKADTDKLNTKPSSKNEDSILYQFEAEQNTCLTEYKDGLTKELNDANLGYNQFPNGESLTYTYDQIMQDINIMKTYSGAFLAQNKINTFKNEQQRIKDGKNKTDEESSNQTIIIVFSVIGGVVVLLGIGGGVVWYLSKKKIITLPWTKNKE